MPETNYAVAPGEYLAEWLDENAMSQQEAANHLGYSRKHVNELANGRAPLTADTALRLERLTAIPADSWTQLEATYRSKLARLREQEQLSAHAPNIPGPTATYLRSIGATTASLRNPGQLVSDFLTYHRCGTWDAFEDRIRTKTTGEYALAALQEHKTGFDPITCATWLRAGELTDEYERGRHYHYNADTLRTLIPELREVAATPGRTTLREFARIVETAGVVFTMVEPPKSFPVYGVTHWIDNRVPVIQQTGRRDRDGFIIWTFFHELGHILNDPRGETHLEFTTQKARNSSAEKAANKFASDVLFGDAGTTPFHGLQYDRDIAATARRLGIAPGVAVHQLHRKRQLPYRYGNRLFVDLEW